MDSNKCRGEETVEDLLLDSTFYHSPATKAQRSLRKREEKDDQSSRCLQLHIAYKTSARSSQFRSPHTQVGEGRMKSFPLLSEELLATAGGRESHFLQGFSP